MAGCRYVREEEISLVLECNEGLSEFSYSESSEGTSDDSRSNSDATDKDEIVTDDTGASQWHSVSDNDPGPSNVVPIANINYGPMLPSSFDSSTEPLEYFYLFFDEDLLNLIVTETNIYGNTKRQIQTPPTKHARMAAWEDCSIIDIKAVIGTVINMGLMPLPDITDYFSNAWVTRIPFFSDVFTRDSFLLLFWNLHFTHVHKTDDPSRERLIKPIVDAIREKCKLHYTPKPTVSVDEVTTSFKIQNPRKQSKSGIKISVLSDSSNGYIYNFLLCIGKGRVSRSTIVKNLCSSLIKDVANPPFGYHIYTDRYFTSPQLAEELLKMNMVSTGAVMTNRKGIPNEIKMGGCKKMEEGDVLAYRKGDQLVLSWKDKHVVTMLSTKHTGSKNEMTLVTSKHPNHPPTMKPNVIVDYMKHMGGVERIDHFIASYQFMRRTRKWSRKIFFWLLEVSIVNSYLLYVALQSSKHRKPLTHKQFRQRLVESLVHDKVVSGRLRIHKPGRPIQGPPEERLTGRHFMSKKEKGSSRCVVCYYQKGERKETIYFCSTCSRKPHLHPDICFELYHT